MSIREILALLGAQEILTWGVGIALVLSVIVEVSKIKINPWSKLAKWFGERSNAKVLSELASVKAELKETKEALDDHIKIDDERNADMHRAYILRFNTELFRNMKHTDEDFHEILYNIDCYEKYCREHPEYSNNRAVLSIENIREAYKEHLRKHDSLQEGKADKKEGSSI